MPVSPDVAPCALAAQGAMQAASATTAKVLRTVGWEAVRGVVRDVVCDVVRKVRLKVQWVMVILGVLKCFESKKRSVFQSADNAAWAASEPPVLA